jgi:DNA-binding IclR family transcriptional regulator
MKDTKGIVARLVAVLGAFADGEPALAISQLSERLGLPPSSVHRLLEQLIELEMIERANHRRYRIGPEFFRIGVRVESKFRIVEMARPLMQKLSDQIDETCVLSVLIRSKRERLRVAKLDSARQPLKFRLQMLERHSLVWGAAGRAILAYMTSDDIERAFADAPQTSTTGVALPSFTRLTKELEQIRLDGYAFARGEFLSTETVGIAAPLFGPGQNVIGDLSIIIPNFRFSDEMLIPISTRLLEITKQLSAMLGASTTSSPPPSRKSRSINPNASPATRRGHGAYVRGRGASKSTRRSHPKSHAKSLTRARTTID